MTNAGYRSSGTLPRLGISDLKLFFSDIYIKAHYFTEAFLKPTSHHPVLILGVLALIASMYPGVVKAQSVSITRLKPTQTPINQTPTKIVLRGTGFTAQSVVFFGQAQVTARINPSRGKIVIRNAPSSFFQNSGAIDIRVADAQGNQSNAVRLVVGSGNSIRIDQPESLTVNVQNSVAIQATVLDVNGTPIPNSTLSFQSANPTQATVDATGQVTGLAAGAATIQVTSGDAVRTLTFSVNGVSVVDSGIFGDGDILVVPSLGRIFASDLRNHVIKGAQVGQPLTTLAGALGSPGLSDGPFTASRFSGPLGLGLGTQRIFLADTANQAIRRFNLQTNQVDTIIEVSDLASTGVTSWGPRGVVQAPDGNLYITDAQNSVIWRARLLGTQVQMSVLAGGIGQPGLVDGPATGARFNNLQEIAITGNILTVTDRGNKVVRLVALPGGAVSTIGSSNAGRPADAGRLTTIPQVDVVFDDPEGVDVDAAGNIYVTDGATVKVLSIVNNQVASISDLAQPGTFQNAVGVSVGTDSTFVLDSGKGQVIRVGVSAPTITSITPTQINASSPPEIVIVGTNFLTETMVTVGNIAATSVTVENSTRLRFTLPPLPFGGTLPVVVQHRGGSAAGSLTVVGTPSAPANLVAQVISPTEVTLTWQDTSSNETGFVVERKLGDAGSFVQVTTTPPNVGSFSDRNLTQRLTVTYRVRAVNAIGASANSNEATAVPRNLVQITFSPQVSTLSPGERLSVGVNFEVSTEPGDQPGTILLDIPLDPTRFDIAQAMATPGGLISSEFYAPSDLVVAPFENGIRIILTSSRNPVNAQINGGKGTFCTLSVPVLSGAPSGSVSIDVSNQPPFATQFNESLKDGAKLIPFSSIPAPITIR
ncbi:MAG: IPT/TIG domain-containing protein [Acidobacteria bacterium]|nr:IPT/TIG domain-containing protein [Acidobacteriota bacterium]